MMSVLLFISAFLLAITSGYFSVYGLKLLFAGAGVSVIVMGIALEFAKIMTASFLHLYWHKISNILKIYLTLAVVILVGITSIGVYGYLSASFNNVYEKIHDLENQRENIQIIESHNQQNKILLQKEIDNWQELLSKEFIPPTLDTNTTASITTQIDNLRSRSLKSIEDIHAQEQRAEEVLNQLIVSETAKITELRNRLKDLDAIVNDWRNQSQNKTFTAQKYIDRANAILAEQMPERESIQTQINNHLLTIQKERDRYQKLLLDNQTRISNIEKETQNEINKWLEREQNIKENHLQLIENKRRDHENNITTLRQQIEKNQEKIKEIDQTTFLHNQQILDIERQITKTDIGTFKFVSSQINWELDQTINRFILLIVIVFDPLAVCLVLAFTASLSNFKSKNLPLSEPIPNITNLDTNLDHTQKELTIEKKSKEHHTQPVSKVNVVQLNN